MTALAQRLYPAVAVDGRFGSSVSSPASSEKQGGTQSPEPSPRGFPPVINADAIRRSFPQQWSEYLKLNFKTAYGVQQAFRGIDSKTARAWIRGDHGPSGGFVAAVIDADPDAIKILWRRA